MATAIDWKAERQEIERALRYARRERDQDYCRMKADEDGAAEDYDQNCAKVKRLEGELEAITGVAEIEQDERLRAAKDQHERERENAGKRHDELLAKVAVSHAERLDAIIHGRGPQAGGSFNGIAPELAALRAALDEAAALRRKFVDHADGDRRFDEYHGINRDLSFTTVQDWLEDALIRLDCVHGRAPTPGRTDEQLADAMRRHAEYGMKRAERQFGRRT